VNVNDEEEVYDHLMDHEKKAEGRLHHQRSVKNPETVQDGS